MRLNRRKRLGLIVSVTPLVDVMMILLVFFMVTSTYLDLDMLPLVGGDRPAGARPAPATAERATGDGASLLVRLAADGGILVSGQPVGLEACGVDHHLGPDVPHPGFDVVGVCQVEARDVPRGQITQGCEAAPQFPAELAHFADQEDSHDFE